ncbi:Transcription factor bHLH95-like protein [Melia azedarach]|uniref:Transcription factor bHLH95-like protein n=1 Tax=Melia azedarach TaxID=155640 RepID=A0ACC1WV01_MELAZ|nr:Transcription factor bHLH95-like protein [Melia azedarach]
MFADHLNKCLEKNNLWVNSSFEVSGGSKEIRVDMKHPDNSSSHSPTAEIEIDAAAQIGQKRSRNGKAASGGGEPEHELHILTERERRKKMRNMFSNLHALLPQLPPKADKSTIVDEAVKYIKTLQLTLQTLQKQKREKLRGATVVDYEQSIITPQVQAPDSREAFLADQGPSPKNLSMAANVPHSFQVSPSATFQTWFSPNVVVNMCGDDAQISVCSPRKPGLLTTIFYILEKHNLDVVSAHISSDSYRSMYMIHARASGAASDQFPGSLSVEEIFKLAVGEMNLWLLTC